MENLPKQQIDKTAVRSSMKVAFCAASLLILAVFIIFSVKDGAGYGIVESIRMYGYFMLIGGIMVWGPSILICLLIEEFFLRKKTTTNGLLLILVIEALSPVVILNIWIGYEVFFITISSVIIAFIAQTVRWIYLKHKSRMYNFILEPKTSYHGELNKATD